VTLDLITSKDDLWEWINLGFIPALGGSGPDGSGAGFVRTYNKLVGTVRLTQRRSAGMDCRVIEDLKKFYGDAKCHSDELSTDWYGKAGLDLAFKAGSGLKNSNEQFFYAWLDPRDVQDAQARCARLYDKDWLDSASRDLVMEATFFNAEVKTFAVLRIVFEFGKAGGIKQSVDLRPLSANLYPYWYHYLPDVLWLLWLFLLWQKETRQLFDSCRQGSEERTEYLTDPWNFVDWSSIVLGFAIALAFWFITSGIEALKTNVGDLGDQKDTFTSFNQDPSVPGYSDAVAYNEKLTYILDSTNRLVTMKIYHRIAMFWYTVILMARFFKGFRGQPRIAVISKTLALASVDLVHYYIILATVFVNFSLGGYVLFGAQLYQWSTIHNAVQSALAMTFGKLDYESLHQIAPISAAIWFWAYIIIVVFILFNMCISIILGHYSEVRASLGEVGQSVWVQGKWLAEDTYWHYSYEFRRLHRIAVSKMKPKWRRRLARFADEVERNPIPMNAMFRQVSANAAEYIRKSMPTLKHDRNLGGGEAAMREVTPETLVGCGCDTVTADELMMRCQRYQSCKADLFNPMDSLAKQLDDHMIERYQHLAELEERVTSQTKGTTQGLEIIEETSARFLEAVRKITPAEEEPPGEAIPGSVWRAIENDMRQVYYFNPQTGESQWDNPVEKKQNRLALAMGPKSAGDVFALAALQALSRSRDASPVAKGSAPSSSSAAVQVASDSAGELQPSGETEGQPAGESTDQHTQPSL
jgi:hypothetical protein